MAYEYCWIERNDTGGKDLVRQDKNGKTTRYKDIELVGYSSDFEEGSVIKIGECKTNISGS